MKLDSFILHDVVHLRVPNVANMDAAEKWLLEQAKAWFGERWPHLSPHIVITSVIPDVTKVERGGQVVNLITTWDVEAVAGAPELLRRLGYTP